MHANATTSFDAGALLGPLMAVLPGSGMPQERLARIAARRAFVDMKLRYMNALARLDGARADWLRQHVRLANQPVDLWLLRRSVLEALGAHDRQSRSAALDIDLAMDSAFPDANNRPA